ncbi:MAG: efflux RND transporter periplasmic adaptor subunit [Candidatus Hydrogenedentes bacterium]|nr:efflux RND transporter periplasmic adaptor subunit [Candidatus Hydrogenedentota bacterium]
MGWILYNGYWRATEITDAGREAPPAPVEVAPIARGPIVFRRTFSGTLEATSAFIVAPKISGRVKRIAADLADPVDRGQTVVELDDQEYVQAVSQSRADLAVAKATLAEAQSTLEIANRELGRVETLRTRGVASESQLDAAKTAQLAAQARLEVARAQLQRAEASLEAARIRLDYTIVTAEWSGGSDRRVVAERFIDAGDTVSANAPLLSIVELSPITGTIFVTERDYARIAVNQEATLQTDAFPGEQFAARVARISPIFRQESRQARVELLVENPDARLKPGLFIRVTIELARETDATIVPEAALTSRADVDGVFIVEEEGPSVVWRPVTVGLREGDRVQVAGEGLQGRVVTLGQQLLDDGSAIIIPADEDEAGSAAV